MSILFGVLGIIGITIADTAVMALMGISVQSFSLFFILPIGGLVEGSLTSRLMFKHLKRKNIKANFMHYMLAALIAFSTFWTINFTYYMTTYVDDNKINHLFKGEHISNYMYNDYEVFTFKNYLDNSFSTTEVKSKHISTPMNFGRGYNKTSFIIDMVGFVIGGLLSGLMVLGGLAYCDKCKRYMTDKELYKIPLTECDEEIKAFSNMLNDTKERVQEFINSDKPSLEHNEAHIQVTLSYCPICKEGYLAFKHLEPKKHSNNNTEWEEKEIDRKKVSLTKEMVEKIL